VEHELLAHENRITNNTPYIGIEIKTNNCHTVGTFPKSNRNIATRDKIDTPNTQMHDC
jgi:hypothetical protein